MFEPLKSESPRFIYYKIVSLLSRFRNHSNKYISRLVTLFALSLIKTSTNNIKILQPAFSCVASHSGSANCTVLQQ